MQGWQVDTAQLRLDDLERSALELDWGILGHAVSNGVMTGGDYPIGARLCGSAQCVNAGGAGAMKGKIAG